MDELREVVEKYLKHAIAYGFDKGYANDHKPDHAKANAIRDELLQALQDEILQARKDELHKAALGTDTEVSGLEPRDYFKRRATELEAQLTKKKEET